VAPASFMAEAVKENVLPGTAISRRAAYMYRLFLPRSPQGQVDSGLAKGMALDTVSLLAPNDSVSKTGETRTLDGIQIEFKFAPGTEAPTEMMFYFPQFRAFDSAEDIVRLLHNLITLRGAHVREGLAWSKAINETIDLFGDKTDVLLSSWNRFARRR
jgi:alkyl sulfatase BDS1-like metallo-beta-lactamase superfamily hydrolase